MAELKEFQTAAVDRIVKMLQTNNSGRYLLADEVGLGKTLIARGVVDKLSRSKKGFTVVYLCSNLEIAAQNAEKLAPNDSAAKPLKDRLTLMTLSMKAPHRSGLRIFSFTPGTSLNLGRATGIKRERRLLLYLISQGLGQTLTSKWREFFKCNPRIADWDSSTGLPALKSEFGDRVHAKFRDKWARNVRHSKVLLHVSKKEQRPFRLASELENCVDEYARYSDSWWVNRNRNIVVSELRKCLAIASLDYLDPDLVVMDEFQRFKQVLSHSRDRNSVEAKLLSDQESKILILSATPYKMYTKSHEQNNHHKDFLDTYAFLNDCELTHDRVTTLKKKLATFRRCLEAIQPDKTVDAGLLEQKRAIELDLHEVMCRTERNRYIEDACKGVVEIPADGENASGVLPKIDELKQYIQLRQFLLRDEKRAREYGCKIMDYWKSGPSLLSFMDGHYSLIKRLRKNDEVIPKHLLLNAHNSLKQSHSCNLKFRQLFEKVFPKAPDAAGDTTSDEWPFLWVKPSYTYYEDTFFRYRAPPRKFLVFSHWHFVPKTVAFLTSAELERRLRYKKGDFKSSPLTFKKGLMSIFDVAMPSLALAAQVDILKTVANISSQPDQRTVERAVRKQLMDLINQPGSGIVYKRKGNSAKTWQAIARLDGLWSDEHGVKFGDQLHAAVADKSLSPASDNDSNNEWFDRFQDTYASWFYDSYSNESFTPIPINERTLKRIVHIALYSPAVAILRSLLHNSDEILTESRTTGKQENSVDLLSYVAKIGLHQLRNYFNRPLVQAIINRYGRGSRYVDKILDYCGLAHLQSVMDEYVFLQTGNINGDENKSTAHRLVEQIGVVFSMHSGSPRINNRVNGRLETDSTMTGSAHFALAFGEDTYVETDDQADYTSRKSDVRTAFNSPFWPFVLATTSVGQEGLDFHLYCKDIVHWNLPSNPVDLEQREGRLNRYNSFAIREMIARDFNIEDVDGFKNLKSNDLSDEKDGSAAKPIGLPWQWVFEAIANEPMNEQAFKQGLYPHWIYVPRAGKFEILRRHLLFYSNSKDIQKYKRLKQELSIYRLVFGQPRQEDVVRKIRENLGDDIDEQILHDVLPIYMINLSPFSDESIWRTAKKKSASLLANAESRDQLVDLVRRLQERNSELLGPAKREIDALVERVVDHDVDVAPSRSVGECAAALYYLVNPYDETYDFFRGIGFIDDLAVVNKVYREHFTRAAHGQQEETSIPSGANLRGKSTRGDRRSKL